MKPLSNHVLAEPIIEEEQSSILLPDAAKDKLKPKPEKAKVLKVGPEVKDVEVGDTIYFRPFAPDVIEKKDEMWLILAEPDILAIE